MTGAFDDGLVLGLVLGGFLGVVSGWVGAVWWLLWADGREEMPAVRDFCDSPASGRDIPPACEPTHDGPPGAGFFAMNWHAAAAERRARRLREASR